MRKIRVGILFGGRSAEHEVSIQSAKNIFKALNKDKYEPVLIGITKKGNWIQLPPIEFERLALSTLQVSLEKSSTKTQAGHQSFSQIVQGLNFSIFDIVLPVLHGPYGEDGAMQGFLKTLGIPFVGADVLGSAVGMDKDIMKRLLRDAGIRVVKFLVFQKKDQKNISFSQVKKELGLPFFVKPANTGSSIGVSKVAKESECSKATSEAFKFDDKILIEQGISVREIECSVLGNDEKIASIPGEVIPSHEFYDYQAKYIDRNGAHLEIPAKLTPQQIRKVQETAIKACEALCIDGMARVDFFVDKKTERIYLNEVNTIPGFTSISMYPKLWEASGIGYSELIDRLIDLALKRSNR